MDAARHTNPIATATARPRPKSFGMQRSRTSLALDPRLCDGKPASVHVKIQHGIWSRASENFAETMMAERRPKIVVVGGGIGGLFAANALIALGLETSVYEQAPSLGEVGAGVFLTPNSVRQLQRVGLGPAVEAHGARVGHDSRYFRHDGTPIAPVQVTDSSGWNATFGMHRADLVELLAAALPRHVVHTGHRCSGFAQDASAARVTFVDGASAEADIVIAADGIHSELRRYVTPPSRPVFHGSVAYRGVLAHHVI